MDTKNWWQSRTIWLQIVAVLFVILDRVGLLPRDLSQEDVVAVVMAIVAIVTIVLRVVSRHAIARPSKATVAETAAKLMAVGMSVALPMAMLGSLSACVTTGAGAVDQVDRIAAIYARIKALAEPLLPLLPPAHVDRVRAAEAIVERALAAAKVASTAAQQLTELRKAEAALREIEAMATPA